MKSDEILLEEGEYPTTPYKYGDSIYVRDGLLLLSGFEYSGTSILSLLESIEDASGSIERHTCRLDVGLILVTKVTVRSESNGVTISDTRRRHSGESDLGGTRISLIVLRGGDSAIAMAFLLAVEHRWS